MSRLGALRRTLPAGLMLCTAAAVAVSGCGSSSGSSGGVSGGVAVRVGNSYTVSKADVAHWVPIEAILSQEVVPKGPIPVGMVPDPPGYNNCLVYQRKLVLEKPGEKTIPSRSRLLRECKERYNNTRIHILNLLTVYGWLREEAAAHGYKVTDTQAQQRFTENTRPEFPTTAAYQQFLTRTGLTQADELWRVKNNMLSNIAVETIFPHQHSLKQAYPEFLLRWAAKTSCAPEYITPNCKQYKGTQPPGP